MNSLFPSGPPPQRPKPGHGIFSNDPKGLPNPKQASMVWIVGPILAIVLFFFLIILVCVLKRRKQNPKQPLEQGES